MHRPRALYSRLVAWSNARRPFVVATVIDTGGSTPRLAGTTMGVVDDAIVGTVGGGAFEKRVIDDARQLLGDPKRHTHHVDVHLVRDLAMCCGGKMSVFMHKVEAAPRLWIYGAGHVGTALAHAAIAAGFEVQIVDGREDWAVAERFPSSAEVIDDEPEDHARLTPPDPRDYAVVVTHSHALDEILIRLLAPRRLRFLGLIGSRRKWASFRQRLIDRSIAETDLDRVQCPIGLDIGAQTPEEIAVSITGQLVRIRRFGAET